MNNQEQDLVGALLVTVGFCSAYALLTIVQFRDLTPVEVASLLQAICASCGVIGLLVLGLDTLKR